MLSREQAVRADAGMEFQHTGGPFYLGDVLPLITELERLTKLNRDFLNGELTTTQFATEALR